jgi:uncharacterized protein YodC (DUF2158 family)
MSQLQVGDVVALKSGGPEMTIRWIENGECYCEWFDGKKVIGHAFTLSSVEKKA